jgi:murein hydrolase activator
MKIFLKSALLLLFLSIALPLFGETSIAVEKKIEKQTQDLRRLEKEIIQLQEKLDTQQSEESNLLDELEATEMQISLLRQRLSYLKRELKLRQDLLKKLTNELDQSLMVKDTLQERYRRRVIRTYKSHQDDWMHLLFEADNINQLFYRVKYITAINQSDRKLFKHIQELMDKLKSQRTAIIDERESIRRNIEAQNQQEKELAALRNDRKNQLNKIRHDKKLLTQNLRDKEKSRDQLQVIIQNLQAQRQKRLAELERQRALRKAPNEKITKFSELKGKMPWPVTGTISTRFGRYKDPVLNIYTENTGIEFRTAADADVAAVMDGLVTYVTWLRGFGNTIIIHHGEDFYTVYSHVDGIAVRENEYVESGQKIAVVSDSGSWDGHILHFEIWDAKSKLNPEDWLRK